MRGTTDLLRALADRVLTDRVPDAVRHVVHHRALMEDVDECTCRRRLALREYRGRAEWEQHIERVRRAFRAAIGPLPEHSPLAVECTGVLERPGYVVEKLLIQTQPGFYATANLYLPSQRRGRAPAILNAVGHWPASKAEPVEQARLIGQARKGYVALVWDPLGQGERSQYRDAPSGVWDAPATTQHAAVCNPAFLVGSTVIATMLWDGVRMVDYLCSRPEVDGGRIGLTGVSGGGTYTTFLGLCDGRIKATVPVCSTATLERMHRQGQIGEPCQDLMAAYPNRLETADLLMAHAPAALQIIAARNDVFPLAGAREVYLDVLECYAALDMPEKVALRVVDGGHDYALVAREHAYAWFNRWLDHDAPVTEEPLEPEPARVLWCTGTGQVLSSIGGRTAPELIRELAGDVIPAPATFDSVAAAARERGRIRAAVHDVLGAIPPLNGAAPMVLPPAAIDGLEVERVILQARMDVFLPAVLVRARGRQPASALGSEAASRGGAGADDAKRPLLIWIDDRGKGAACVDGGLVHAVARAGLPVLAVDLRGWGETAWVNQRFGWSQDRRAVLGAENMLAYVGYSLGHWSPTQRVHDALGVLRWARGRPDVESRRILLAGRGGGAVVALHAAAVDGEIAGVASVEGLATYRSLVSSPRYVHPVADFLPGVLRHYDLPELAGALAPAHVLVLGPQDALGEPLEASVAREVYAPAIRRSELLGGSVRVEAGAATEGTHAGAARDLIALADRILPPRGARGDAASPERKR